MSKQKYRCLLLVRVSSVGQHDGEGPELQMDRGFRCAEERFSIPRDQVKLFVETYSGRKEERPHLEEVYDIVANERISLVLFYDIDRLTRAGPAFYERAKRRFQALGAEIADVKGIIQPSANILAGSGGDFGADFEYEWSVHSPSEKAEVLEAQMAKDEARKILSRTIPVQIKNAQSGLTTRLAPYGYRNVKIIGDNGQPQASKEPHEDEAFFVRKIFELKARGCDTVSITYEIDALGYKSRTKRKWSADRTTVIGTTGGNPITAKEVLKIVRRVDYAGFNLDRWTHGYPVKANHAGLVDIELWNKANEGEKQILACSDSPTGWELAKVGDAERRAYSFKRPDFPFKGMLACSGCMKQLTASYSKGKLGTRYGYYHCKSSKCKNRLSVSKTHTEIEGVLTSLKFSPEAAQRFEDHIRQLWVSKVGDANARLITLNKEIAELRSQADAVLDKLKMVQSQLIIARLEAEFEDLMARAKALEVQRAKKEVCEDKINQVLTFAKYLVEHLDDLVMNAEEQGLRELFWDLIFVAQPSIADLQNQTLAISPLMRLKDELEGPKGPVAAVKGLGSNPSCPTLPCNGPGLAQPIGNLDTLLGEIGRWMNLADAIMDSVTAPLAKEAF